MTKSAIEIELKELEDEWERLDSTGQVTLQNKIVNKMEELNKRLKEGNYDV